MRTYHGTFRKLIVWQEAKALTKLIYHLAKKFPSDEKFVLVSQIKRAAVSVMSIVRQN